MQLLTCPKCNGLKKILGLGMIEKPCSYCDSTGYVHVDEDQLQARTVDYSAHANQVASPQITHSDMESYAAENDKLREDLRTISDGYASTKEELAANQKRIQELEAALAKSVNEKPQPKKFAKKK